MPEPILKTCTQCGESKPLSEYYTDRGKPTAQCKVCKKAVIYAARDADRDAFRAYQRAWKEANRERMLATRRARWRLRADELNAKRRAERAENNLHLTALQRAAWHRHKERRNAERSWAVNPERRAQAERYRQENREKVLEWARRARYKRRVLMAEAFVEDVSLADILQRDVGVCGICRKQIMESTVELDHIVPLAAGGRHERENIQLAHRSCNRRKFTKLNFSLDEKAA
jgi:5-methylcytosine-specific restriction endonuclease McrA